RERADHPPDRPPGSSPARARDCGGHPGRRGRLAGGVHRPFMGFLLGRNLIVAPNALGHWSGFHAGVPFGGKLIAVDGRPVERVPDLVEETWAGHPAPRWRYTSLTPRGRVNRRFRVFPFGSATYSPWSAVC